MKQLGDAANGVYAQSYFQEPGTTSESNDFSKAFEAVDSQGEQDTNAEESYSAVYIFASAAAHLTEFSGPSVLVAMNSAKNITTPIMAAIPSFPADSRVPGFPRVAIFSFYSYQWSNGKYNVLRQRRSTSGRWSAS